MLGFGTLSIFLNQFVIFDHKYILILLCLQSLSIDIQNDVFIADQVFVDLA